MRGKEGFLILLKVALIASWQALESGEQADVCSSDLAGLATNQFPGIGIFLLRHEAAAGGVLVGQNDVREFLGCEDYEIFGETRKMRGDAGQREQIVERKISVADGIEAVGSEIGRASC